MNRSNAIIAGYKIFEKYTSLFPSASYLHYFQKERIRNQKEIDIYELVFSSIFSHHHNYVLLSLN